MYFCCYDYFAANDPTSIHVIVFSLEEPYEIQLNQVIFWLSFLKSLVPVEEPIGEQGPSFFSAVMFLLGSSRWPHSDPTEWGSQLCFPPSPEPLTPAALPQQVIIAECTVESSIHGSCSLLESTGPFISRRD